MVIEYGILVVYLATFIQLEYDRLQSGNVNPGRRMAVKRHGKVVILDVGNTWVVFLASISRRSFFRQANHRRHQAASTTTTITNTSP